MHSEDITARAAILVHRPRDEVFNAFYCPAVMSRFWFERRDGGLREGERQFWYFGGQSADTPDIEVRVRRVDRPSEIVFDWGHGDRFTTVTFWLFEHAPATTLLQVQERGFAGTRDQIVTQALDSTCGFNQVVVAAKALLEHDAVINIVADHA